MNTNAAPHLDVEDLIAEVNGQPIDDRARDHLARCEHCRAEINRWELVAGGVRGLAADAPPAGPPWGRPRVGALRRRIVVAAVSAAAAVVLLAGVGYGVGAVHIGTGSGSAVLTSVSGCTGLKQAMGTLEQVDGASLVVKTASGQLVTVITTASTSVNLSGPFLSDITDGASVVVRGSSSDGTIAAVIVTVGPPFSAVNPAGFVPVRGTVADASSTGFTLVTSSGSRIRVTTSSGTLVIVPRARLDQLFAGATIFGFGQAGPDGTLSARAVAAIRQLTSGPRLNVTTRSCSPTAIAEAFGG